MASFQQFKHCYHCRNKSMIFMCKKCDKWDQYVPRYTTVQGKVVTMLVNNPGFGLKITEDGGVDVCTPKGVDPFKKLHSLKSYGLYNIRRDTLQGLVDRFILLPDGERKDITFTDGFFKLNEEIKWGFKV